MKKIAVILLLAGMACTAAAQKTPAKPAPKPVAKPVAGPVLKNQVDSVSYVLGMFIARNLNSQGFEVSKLNRAAFNAALSDVAAGKKPAIDDGTGNGVLNTYAQVAREKQAQAKKAEAKAFFDKNAKRPGVITLPSGLQYEVLTMGTGEKLTLVDTFICHYRGTLIDGTEFDASYNSGRPLKMALNQVIAGWQEALQLLPVGSKFKLYIPAELGYGMMGQGKIPPGATLVFDMDLQGLVRKSQQ